MRRREAATGLLLASPAVVGLLAFLVLPFGYTFLRSFTTGLGWGRFVGLENYAQLFENRLFLLALKNTFLFLACGLALILPLSLFLALLLQKAGKWGKPLALALLFPMVLPVSAIVIVVNLVFAGERPLEPNDRPHPLDGFPLCLRHPPGAVSLEECGDRGGHPAGGPHHHPRRAV